MSRLDLIRMGVKNLWRRKLRTFLTILGVVIGTSSIIVMLSLGFGMDKAYTDQIGSMGSLTTINVHKGWGTWDEATQTVIPNAKEVVLDDKAVVAFRELKNVVNATPLLETYGILVVGKYQNHLQIRGIEPDAMEAFEFDKLSEGRLLENTDDLVAVFGSWVSRGFWNPKSSGRGPRREPDIDLMKDRMFLTLDQSYGWDSYPGEEKPVYKEYRIKAAGIFEEGNQDTDWYTYMPLKTVENLIKEREKIEGGRQQQGRDKDKGYEQVLVKVGDMKYVQDVQDQIKAMGFEAYSLNDWLDEMKKTAAIMQAILGGIGAVSLLVAAIGITNTMVMSIYERTREIGVMKVIGASLKDIKRLFLFESALIGLLGGVLGVGFSLLLSFLANKFGGVFGDFMYMGMAGEETKISIIPIWLMFAAMGFSSIIGVISGYFPARRAMNLSALEAIRSE